MGTTAHVIGVGADGAWLDDVVRRLDALEARWSRFVPTSDVCRANACQGEPTVVAPETARLVATALLWSRRTGGRFQPAVLDALVAAGYDRTFADVGGGGSLHGTDSVGAPAEVDLGASTITVHPGAAIDLGGIGKGAAADLVAAAVARGTSGGCINLGGDLRVWGEPPDGAAAWWVAVEVPGHADLTIGLTSGAVATSSTERRRWRTVDGDAHHVIDPSTGRPAVTDLRSVTVVADSATTAEVRAKVALIAGADEAARALDGTPALLCTRDGRVLAINGMEAHLS